ncbi:uncharacterized protein LOC135500868 [Lineus longissimus]|uniref:uncharacterized protein LOC135500868 n=1 Tax=Lineus longissimus TaxID=88925 RepID=UPI002B4C804E
MQRAVAAHRATRAKQQKMFRDHSRHVRLESKDPDDSAVDNELNELSFKDRIRFAAKNRVWESLAYKFYKRRLLYVYLVSTLIFAGIVTLRLTVSINLGFNGSATDGRRNSTFMTNGSYRGNRSAGYPSPFVTFAILMARNHSDTVGDGKQYGYGDDVTEGPDTDSFNETGDVSPAAGTGEYVYGEEDTLPPDIDSSDGNGSDYSQSVTSNNAGLETKEGIRTFTGENTDFRTSDLAITTEPETASNPMQNSNLGVKRKLSTLIPKLFTRTKFEMGKRTTDFGNNAGISDGVFSKQSTTDIPAAKGQHVTTTGRQSSVANAASEHWEIVPTANAFERQESSSSTFENTIHPTDFGDLTDADAPG